ncbi:MAG: 50S ribosomal protein L18 [Candidatus Rehaiarchaeum fermentans]|nr:50S ribosomal protein L18 [Candidatus Rehaiarchaeum fermentans]MCW1302033.1 50S ribosomal protein L18 [Candidatus Rehaiarchaeum fermentans]
MRPYTDYRKRIKLLRSGLPRLVVRKTNHTVITQIIKTILDEEGNIKDITIASAYGRELKKFDWPFSFKNLPSSYLTGYLLARKSKINEELILDKGLYTLHQNSFIFSALKGAIDGGLKVRAGEINISNDRIMGLHIINISQKSSGLQFSKVKDKISKIKEIFQEVKNKIDKEYGAK